MWLIIIWSFINSQNIPNNSKLGIVNRYDHKSLWVTATPGNLRRENSLTITHGNGQNLSGMEATQSDVSRWMNFQSVSIGMNFPKATDGWISSATLSKWQTVVLIRASKKLDRFTKSMEQSVSPWSHNMQYEVNLMYLASKM